MADYPFAEIESKWQRIWEKIGAHRTDMSDTSRKLYSLVMFSYPSGEKLHIGHWYNYGPADTWTRFKKMQGYNVFEPMGFDAFGLPAENYAIKHGVHPAVSTAENIDYIRQQIKAIGAMYDWDKEINTSDPEYYKWTQWLFLQLYKHGLAYRKRAPVNWCPQCRTVLANEQVVQGLCERCDSEVTKRDLTQWFFRITAYAERLLKDHAKIDWPEKTLAMQRNWIGRSEGALLSFHIEDDARTIEVFTTRPDTLYGMTYVVMAPEHPLVSELTTSGQKSDVDAYCERSRRISEIERISADREKTGVFIGRNVINPINGERVPLWIADYVLASYGTGIVFACPAHDERDFEFAQKFGLPIREVVRPNDGPSPLDDMRGAYIEPGIMVNSGPYNGLTNEECIARLVEDLNKKGQGKKTVQYKLRDWLVSRQRYWGAPIPIIYCKECGELPVPEEDLPVLLPQDVDFKPTGSDLSPLASASHFLNTKCPKCGGAGEREVDTMDTFVCSSWYFLRYPDPHCEDGPFSPELVKQWLPVDHYMGGAEHAVMHLLYARFVTKALFDLGFVHFDEPFMKLTHQGQITKDGARMSKSRGNVVNPEEFIESFGADTFRMYLMFMGSYEDGGDWNDQGIGGIFRFLNRIWRLYEKSPSAKKTVHPRELDRWIHKTIKRVTGDVDRLHFNTAIAALMEYVNYLYLEEEKIEYRDWNRSLDILALLLAPFAPHAGEELWEKLGHDEGVFRHPWPTYDNEAIKTDHITVVVQINGKVRAHLDVEADISEDALKKIAFDNERVQKYTEGKKVKKTVYVQKKLLSIVAQ
ncbi:MAG: leucine--tRNA ligase [Gemmatimonadota bacterium]|nr:MAG: leucine--tRNA ligase [Gemmatimonadota bacterium]